MNRFIVILLLAFVQLVASNKHVIDQQNTLTGLEDVCNLPEDARISRISTINKLLEHFEASTDATCRQHWLEPLRDLHQILAASHSDACGLATINKIEEFYYNYLVGTLSRSWRKVPTKPIPEPLRVFFVHFAETALERCKSRLAHRLTEGMANQEQAEPSYQLQSGLSIGPMIDAFSIALVPQSKVKKFDDFLLIFDSVVAMEKRKGRSVEEAIPDPITGEVTYVSIKLRDPARAHEVQEKCKQELRPIYRDTVLPVMRLIDMGFGSKGESFYNEVEGKLIAKWYGITQFCESFVPVKFYQSKELKDDQVSLVEKKEAEVFENQKPAEGAPEVPVRVQPVGLGDVDVVESADDDHVLSRVKGNIKSRAKIYRKIFKNVFAAVRSVIKSKRQHLFSLMRRKKNKKDEQPSESEGELTEYDLVKSIEHASKMMDHDELEDRTEETGLNRQKRGFRGLINVILALIIFFLIVILVLHLLGYTIIVVGSVTIG